MRKSKAILISSGVVLTMFIVASVGSTDNARTAAVDQDGLQRSVSSNESMIRRFKSQITKLTGQDKKTKELQTKIQSLENQNEIVRRSLESQDAAGPVSSQAPFSEKNMEALIGEDWARLAKREKERFVYTAIGGLERQGVFITKRPSEYLEAMDFVLNADAAMHQEYLENIFVFCVYDGEPQTREAINKIRSGNV